MKKKSTPGKLWFDARMIGHSGIGTQILNVLNLLMHDKNIQLNILGETDKIKSMLPEFKAAIIEFNKPIYSISEQLKFPKPGSNDLIHSPHYNANIRHIKNSVVVVHDLIHLQSDEFSGPQYRLYAWILLKIISKYARHIITVSEATRLELIKRFPLAQGKTTVIYNGLDHDLFKPASHTNIIKFKKKYNLPSKYLLTVGIGKKHKNIDFIVRSLAPSWKNGSLKLPLVIAGTKGHLPDYIKREVNKWQVNEHVIVLPFVQESELAIMYSAATLFIYPSLLEGFGFPLVEAMACGCPALVSDASCLPEIGANAALYFNAKNQKNFEDLLFTTLKNKQQMLKMSKAGLKRAKKFSWKRHVNQLSKVYATLFKANQAKKKN